MAYVCKNFNCIYKKILTYLVLEDIYHKILKTKKLDSFCDISSSLTNQLLKTVKLKKIKI